MRGKCYKIGVREERKTGRRASLEERHPSLGQAGEIVPVGGLVDEADDRLGDRDVPLVLLRRRRGQAQGQHSAGQDSKDGLN